MLSSHLGADVHALGEVGTQHVTARLDTDTRVSVGEIVNIGVELESIHLFDRESGRSFLRA